MYGNLWPYTTKASAFWKVGALFFRGRFGRFPVEVLHLVSSGRDYLSTFSKKIGPHPEMTDKRQFTLALFYCQNIPESSLPERQALEEAYGPSLKLFPIPCTGRLEPLHLLRALEEFADAAYVIACPGGACRYFEGNLRARKRVGVAGDLISAIGLERERVGLVANEDGDPKPLATLAREVMDRVALLEPSPVLNKKDRQEGDPP
jgi:F420-non-reducing hydrogenase iron-sulfur subunit